MEARNYRLLEAALAQYDETERPVTADILAGVVEGDVDTVADGLATLESCDLLAVAGDGYRPTVTARELLALDIDDPDLLVIDTDGNC